MLISDHFPKMVNKFPDWKKICFSMHFDSLLNARLYSFYFWTTKFVFIFRMKFCAVYLVHFCTTWILIIIRTQSAFHTAILFVSVSCYLLVENVAALNCVQRVSYSRFFFVKSQRSFLDFHHLTIFWMKFCSVLIQSTFVHCYNLIIIRTQSKVSF